MNFVMATGVAHKFGVGLRTFARLVLPIAPPFNFTLHKFALEIYAFCLIRKLFYNGHVPEVRGVFFYITYRYNFSSLLPLNIILETNAYTTITRGLRAYKKYDVSILRMS